MNLRPTPSQERWLLLARRLGRNTSSGAFRDYIGGWRTASLTGRCMSFVLGLIAVAMLGIIAWRFAPTSAPMVAGLLALLIAEWLILARQYFGSGIEEALEAGAAFLLAAQVCSLLGCSESTRTLLLGAAVGLAGLRLLNPLFTTLAAVALLVGWNGPGPVKALLCYGIALAALGCGSRSFRRPSHDRMLDALMVVMPLAGYFWSAALGTATDYTHARLSAWWVPIAPLLFGTVALAVGLKRRTHAPLLACMLCVACTAYELRAFSGLSLQVRLIAWGCALLVIAAVLERHLRVPRHGITSRRLPASRESAGLLATVSGALLTPHSRAAPGAPAVEGAGGRFGGGGASGNY